MKFFSVTVSYNAGLVRTFLVPVEMLALTFVRATTGLGRMRRMDFAKDEVNETAAHQLARTAGAIVLNVDGNRAEVSYG